MSNLLVIGWYQIYELEREQRQDDLAKLKASQVRQEQLIHAEFEARLNRGQLDD